MATVSAQFQTELYYQQLFAASRGIICSLKDEALTATRSHNANHGPKCAKLGAPVRAECSHAWCCVKPMDNDHLTVDLGTSHIVTGIEIAGRGTAHTGQMVTKFRVQTSGNGIDWVDQGTYLGTFAPSTSVKRKLNKAVVAMFVRITPLEFKEHPSMRIDVLVYDTN